MSSTQQHPNDYARRILVAVTGLSPQIVTETFYALAVDSHIEAERFVPTEIHLITTAEGAERARLMLFEHEGGRFNQLCQEYGLDREAIDFGPHTIHIAPDGQGQPLHDINDQPSSAAVADLISEKLRQFTADEGCAIHASIAGGRKTMGFYLGYALSLYGRRQDRLSHVLVSPPFESDHQFYYPPAQPTTLIVKDRPVHTSEAKILLADIPFVRLRESLPETLRQEGATFSEAVHSAQQAVPPLALELNPATRNITAAGESFSLGPVEFAFYWMLAARTKNGQPGRHWSNEDLVDELLHYLAQLINPDSGDYEKAETAYRRGYGKESFDPRKSHINAKINQALGKRVAKPYLITRLDTIAGSRYHRSGLKLPPEVITIHQNDNKPPHGGRSEQ